MFKIGDFSRLTSISIRMLRFYDQNDILKPVYIDEESGYRYYQREQIFEASQVRFLRDIGFSTARIKAILENYKNAEEIEKYLEIQLIQLKEEADKIDSRIKICLLYTSTDHFDTVIEESEAWYDRNKTTIVNSDRIYVLGYGVDYGSVLEGMLKIGEMLRLPTIGYEIEEYSHGPTMAITKQQTLFMIGSDDVEWDRMLKFREVFKKYTDRVHLITCKDTDVDDRDVNFSVKTNKYLAPLMYTVPFQFVSAKGALDIGIDTGVNPFKDQLAHLPE